MHNKHEDHGGSWYNPDQNHDDLRYGGDRGFPEDGQRHYTAASDEAPNRAGYGYQAQAPGFVSPYIEKKGRGRSSALKAVTLTLSILILIIASALLFMGDEPAGTISGEQPGPGSSEGSNWSDDFRDYFDSYYSMAASSAISIETIQADSDLSLLLAENPVHPELTLQEIYSKCAPCVVSVNTYVNGQAYSWGTGIIFRADGYILTNTHVLEGVDSATVILSDNSEYQAKLVGADTRSDIAILKVDGENLPYAEVGDSSLIQVGDSVVAIGNPLGEELRGTMTNGIISAINRDISYSGYTMTLLQTNAAINEGNSGGPLINMYGQVIGITNMKMISYYTSIEGIGFAIPASTIKLVVDELVENGYVSGRPTIGITCGSIPAKAAEHYDIPDGVYIRTVNEKSDAYKKGIREGDIITKVNGTPVTTPDEVNSIKDKLAVGDTLLLTIYRDGKTFEASVVLVEAGSLG